MTFGGPFLPCILSCSWASCLICCTPFSLFHHAVFCSFLAFWSDLLLLSLYLLYKGLVDNIYPKEYTNDSKQGLCCHRAEGHPLCYNRVGFNILISIESLSHVLNNVPFCSPLHQIFNKVKAKMCEIVLKNTSNLDLFQRMISKHSQQNLNIFLQGLVTYTTEFYTSMFWFNDYVQIAFQSILIIEQGSL